MGGVFSEEPRQKGTALRDILDGISNTILVVEATRDIPWTKPEDIPFAADKDPPDLGGFYDEGLCAVFADGAGRFLARDIDQKLLKLLITMNDGQPLPIPTH